MVTGVRGQKLMIGKLDGNKLHNVQQNSWRKSLNSQMSVAEWSFSSSPFPWLSCWHCWLLWSFLSWPLIFPYLGFSCDFLLSSYFYGYFLKLGSFSLNLLFYLSNKYLLRIFCFYWGSFHLFSQLLLSLSGVDRVDNFWI